MWEGRYIRAMRQGRWEYASRCKGMTAVVILAEVDGKVLLIEQERVPIGKRCIELPAGLVGDEDEACDGARHRGQGAGGGDRLSRPSASRCSANSIPRRG